MSDGTDDGGVSRRRFLRTAAGTATAAGVTGTAAAQEGGGNESGGGGGGNESGGGGGGGGSTTVKVGPGGALKFEPEEVQIQPGGTVEWVWESGGHNVVPESSGDWGQESISGPGTTYTHTFKEAAEVPYVCEPHAGSGMKGTIVVGSGGGGGSSTALPSSAKAIGVAATAAMTSTLGLAYFFIRYGGDYEQPGE
jgi:plastocyanin